METFEMWLRADTVDQIADAMELMGLMDGGVPVLGCGCRMWEPNTIMDGGTTTNEQAWGNVICYAPLTATDVDAAKGTFRTGATPATKPSTKGNGDSKWSLRSSSAAMFEESYAGNPHPESPRMTWQV